MKFTFGGMDPDEGVLFLVMLFPLASVAAEWTWRYCSSDALASPAKAVLPLAYDAESRRSQDRAEEAAIRQTARLRALEQQEHAAQAELLQLRTALASCHEAAERELLERDEAIQAAELARGQLAAQLAQAEQAVCAAVESDSATQRRYEEQQVPNPARARPSKNTTTPHHADQYALTDAPRRSEHARQAARGVATQ